jgi:hypothetical protein
LLTLPPDFADQGADSALVGRMKFQAGLRYQHAEFGLGDFRLVG